MTETGRTAPLDEIRPTDQTVIRNQRTLTGHELPVAARNRPPQSGRSDIGIHAAEGSRYALVRHGAAIG